MQPLPPCPNSPNCVSSDATGTQHIDAFRCKGDPAAAWQSLLEHLRKDDLMTVISHDEEDIIATARTRLMGFIDDLHFQLRAADGEIAVRSASRLGYWDLGKNRQRLEQMRRTLQNQGILAGGE